MSYDTRLFLLWTILKPKSRLRAWIENNRLLASLRVFHMDESQSHNQFVATDVELV